MNRSLGLARWLDRIADRILAAGVEQERTVWVGFSQGACLVLEYMLRHPNGGAAWRC